MWMIGVQPRKPASSQLPVKNGQEREGDEREPNCKHHRNDDVGWPMRTTVDPGIRDQCGRNNIKSAPPAKEKDGQCRNNRVVHRVTRWEGTSDHDPPNRSARKSDTYRLEE